MKAYNEAADSTSAFSLASAPLRSYTPAFPVPFEAATAAAQQKDAIAAAAGRQDFSKITTRGNFPFPDSSNPLVWVKFSTDRTKLTYEAMNQQFVAKALDEMGPEKARRVCAPHILNVFEKPVPESTSEGNFGFIVMEYTPFVSVGGFQIEKHSHGHIDMDLQDRQLDRVSDAISVMLDIPTPADAKPGPVGGGIIRSFCFAGGIDQVDYDFYADAPREFHNLKDLEEYVVKANELVSATTHA